MWWAKSSIPDSALLLTCYEVGAQDLAVEYHRPKSQPAENRLLGRDLAARHGHLDLRPLDSVFLRDPQSSGRK